MLNNRLSARARAICSSSSAAIIEGLEGRRMFAADPGDTFATAFNVGDLNGQQTFNDSVSTGDFEDFYRFTMPRDGMFFGRARAIKTHARIELYQETLDAHGVPQETLLDSASATQDGPDSGFSTGDLPGRFLKAGTYFIQIGADGTDAAYFMAMTADYAGDSLKTARNVGIATDATFQDYIGITPSRNMDDVSDVFKVKMEAAGQFTARLSLDNMTPNAEQAFMQVIHDFNGDGIIDSQDVLSFTSVKPVGTASLKLTAGTYFVRLGPSFNSSNYHLSINADYASAGSPRAMGSLDKLKSFNDFISNPADLFDDYTFSVTNTRPFFTAISESGGKPVLGLYTDPNNDGKPDQLLGSVGGEGFAKMLRTIDAGHYVLRVQAMEGSGTYQLVAEARPDIAGNTLSTAKNLGAINGLKHLDDYVDGSDPVDFYKFTSAASGTIGASIFCDFANANLSLIRDANNNGIVDTGDVLATGQITPMSQVKEFTAKISAGTYFLRAAFNDLEGFTSKYSVSFQTDYAGSTPKTARNVGSLFGTKTFDDWASGPFTGAISDTLDLYKFSLSSTRTLTAKTTGSLSGQELVLQLYRDKNNDGVLSSNELIAASNHLNSPNEQISKSLSSGTYYVRVVGVNGETNYHLSLTA